MKEDVELFDEDDVDIADYLFFGEYKKDYFKVVTRWEDGEGKTVLLRESNYSFYDKWPVIEMVRYKTLQEAFEGHNKGLTEIKSLGKSGLLQLWEGKQ